MVLNMSTIKHSIQHYPKLGSMFIIALIMSVGYWGLGLLAQTHNVIFVWGDLAWTFSKAITYWGTPYEIPGYFSTPWANLFLIPFELLPIQIVALLMITIYFCLITLLIYKYKGDRISLILTLTSILALDTALEINIDWLVCIGLIIPKKWSLPFLLIKPQTAMGYILSFSKGEFIHAMIVILIVLIASFLIWGEWINDLFKSIEYWETNSLVNLAPITILPSALAIFIGILISIYGWRKHDAIACIIGGIFFVPYIAPNSLLISLALLSTRYKKSLLFISLICWIITLNIIFKFVSQI